MEEASEAELRYRMQGAAFMGAFFKVSGIVEREGLDAVALGKPVQYVQLPPDAFGIGIVDQHGEQDRP